MTSSTDAGAPEDAQRISLDTSPSSHALQIDRHSLDDDTVGWQSKPLADSDETRLLAETDAIRREEDTLPTFHEEARAIWSMGWQVSVTTFCRISLSTISTMFLGRIGSRELAASALANVWTGGVQILIFGFAVSVCTLCGQAYGAKNYRLVGVWLQLALLLLLLLSVPVMVSFFYVDRILSAVTDDREILALADTYARFLAPSVLPQAVYCALRQYLQAQEIVRPATIISVASVAVSLGSNYLFIYGCGSLTGLGFIGAPIAQSVASIFQPTALVIYAFWYKGYHKKTWFGWDLRSCLQWERMRTFAYLSAGMTMNLALDEWVYNVISALAGSLGAWNLAANSILFNLWGLIFGIYWGFGLPTQVRVANFMGANRPEAAKRTLHVGFVLGGLTAFVSALLVYVCRDTLAGFFTHDPAVVSAITSTMPIFCTAVFVSGLHVIMSAVVEAMSLATTLVVITTIGSWVVMLPASYLMGLAWNGGLHGLWWGSLVGETVKFALMVLALWHIDWREMAHRAVLQSEGDVLTEEELEEDIRLRSELVLPSTPTLAGTTPVLAILSTPQRVHHRHQTVSDATGKRDMMNSSSYGSVNALHNFNREQ
ncbi:MatE [Phytophthora infestans]|uniref:MatE n=1 Tax=Phytophthora infestans TaxID=4787 RepID=A0A8S9USV6_PHYIN|nr:MatE [Phytophthora infestans]